jgi:carboxyl-terminal processing protease
VASVKDRSGKVHFLKDPNRGTIYDGPMLVLVNGASASASEFVSAVLQDYNRAIIAGGSTYGKGTAQVVLPMDTLSGTKNEEDFVKVTQQKFYRVNGSTTQWKGVVPDIELPDLYADDSFKEKNNSSALQPDNSKTGIYQPLPPLPIAALKAKSANRMANDPYFKLINEFSNWVKSSKTGMNVSLQWSSYVNQYKKAREMFAQFSKEDHSSPAISTVTNNGFDSERMNLSSMHSRSINDTYLKQVKNDMTIAEAYNIMMDWIGK